MSVGTWKCADCGGEGYHFNLCPRLWRDPRDAEITALRAALDQERADNAKLRAFALGVLENDQNKVWGYAHVEARKPEMAALLSGRGEGRADG